MFSIILSLVGFYFSEVDYSSAANNGLRNVIYYGDWSVWGGQENFYPDAIAADSITHLNFAFMDFNANGVLELTDSGAAHDNPVGHNDVSWGDANAGILPAFQNLRANNPNIRLGVSLGGWSKSGDFSTVLKNSATRAKLVDQLAKFIEYNNFDFIDIDWEYPGSVRAPDYCDNQRDEGTPNADVQDGKYFIQFLQEIKDKELDMGKKNNRVYELTIALPASIGNFDNGAQAFLPSGVTKASATVDQLNTAATEYITQMFSIIDFGNLMTYDMRGAFDTISGHHSGLFSHVSGIPEADALGFSADLLVSYLLGKKEDSLGNRLNRTISGAVDPSKLVIGSAFYSRGWEQVANDGVDPVNYPGLFGNAAIVGRDADDTPSPGAKNAVPTTNGDGGRLGGVWPYGRFAELHKTYPGLKYNWDDVAQAPYFYDPSTGTFISYDSPKSIAAKTDYVKKNGLGGIISWMASMDAATGDEENGQYSAGAVRGVLAKAIKTGLWGSTALEKFNVGAPLINVSAVISIGTAPYSSDAALIIDLTNNYKNTETDACLVASANVAGTITVPRVYITLKSGVSVRAGNSYEHGTWSQDGNVVTVYFTEFSLKTMGPGVKINLNMPCSTAIGVSDVLKIEMSRQIYTSGKEIGRSVIYQA